MDLNILKQIIIEQKEDFEKDTFYVEREILLKLEKEIDLPYIFVISGIRRSGKSTLLKQIKKKFYNNNVTYYFNFEEERLLGFSVEHFDLLYQALLEIYGKSKIFFFDEIQNIKGWELFVRRMHDRGFKFFITGSNSSMLSKELGTRLTGRYIPLEVYPFSFREFLNFKKIDYKKNVLTTEKKAFIRSCFIEYVEKGGFPEILLYNSSEALKILYDNIIYRDILVRYGINDEKTMRDLSLFLFSNHSKNFSYNNLKKILNVGSPNTIKSYLSYLENSYLLFSINKYSNSLKEQIYSDKKIYAIDTGLIKKISFKVSQDLGRVFENIVFIELKRANYKIYYFKDKKECDFVIFKDNKKVMPIQVCQSLQDSETRLREYNGLLEAMNFLKLKQGIIITENEEKTEYIKNKKINIVPLWKWLLE
ncbi:MAG: ATP-binding protein [Candidatus Woesearchaeota archaeon]